MCLFYTFLPCTSCFLLFFSTTFIAITCHNSLLYRRAGTKTNKSIKPKTQKYFAAAIKGNQKKEKKKKSAEGFSLRDFLYMLCRDQQIKQINTQIKQLKHRKSFKSHEINPSSPLFVMTTCVTQRFV